MAQLTRPYDVINLAQGFPDFDPPAELIEAAVQALRTGHNQYARRAFVRRWPPSNPISVEWRSTRTTSP
jgi:aspartate/methionine/tyrosine aminotransferase